MEGVPVQVLVTYISLVQEAVEQAVEVPYEDITTRIATAEQLVASWFRRHAPRIGHDSA